MSTWVWWFQWNDGGVCDSYKMSYYFPNVGVASFPQVRPAENKPDPPRGPHTTMWGPHARAALPEVKYPLLTFQSFPLGQKKRKKGEVPCKNVVGRAGSQETS